MRSAKTDLKLKKLFVLYPGNKRYLLSEGIEVVGLQEFLAGKAFNS
jgi:hypothetical protein